MKKNLIKSISYLLLTFLVLPSTTHTRIKSYRTRSYTKKSPYAGLGKRSRANGLLKTKTVSGHGKRTRTGYRYVNPYARSR